MAKPKVPRDKTMSPEVRSFLEDMVLRVEALGGTSTFNVLDYGALGDGVNDDTQSIADAIDAANDAYANSGIVYFPLGTYIITDTLTVPNAVRLLGSGDEGCILSGQSNFNLLNFTGNGSMERLWIVGYINAGATQSTVITANNARNFFRDCKIWGGKYALKSRGADGIFENLFCSANGSGGAHVYSSGASQYYIRCKFDDAGGPTVSYSLLMDEGSTGSLQQSHFTLCDFSGTFAVASIAINDSDQSHISATFTDSTFTDINITNANAIILTSNEVSGLITVTNDVRTVVTGNFYFSGTQTVAGANTVVSGNYGIS